MSDQKTIDQPDQLTSLDEAPTDKGRVRYYEGDDAAGFAAEIKAEFGFDPSEDEGLWGMFSKEGNSPAFVSYAFICPDEHLDAVYYSERWPLGS